MESQPEPCVSPRLRFTDPNGRDYLANMLGWSCRELEDWINSPSVRPHLQVWYEVGVLTSEKYNEVVSWIEEGPHGYFYIESGFEEDLLFICLGKSNAKGAHGAQEPEPEALSYADAKAQAMELTTRELWVKTVCKIVHANQGAGEKFANDIHTQPVACYALVINLLLIAFHSLAFRGRASCYWSLINRSLADNKKWREYEVEAENDLIEADTESAATSQADSEETQGGSNDAQAGSEYTEADGDDAKTDSGDAQTDRDDAQTDSDDTRADNEDAQANSEDTEADNDDTEMIADDGASQSDSSSSYSVAADGAFYVASGMENLPAADGTFYSANEDNWLIAGDGELGNVFPRTWVSAPTSRASEIRIAQGCQDECGPVGTFEILRWIHMQ